MWGMSTLTTPHSIIAEHLNWQPRTMQTHADKCRTVELEDAIFGMENPATEEDEIATAKLLDAARDLVKWAERAAQILDDTAADLAREDLGGDTLLGGPTGALGFTASNLVANLERLGINVGRECVKVDADGGLWVALDPYDVETAARR